MVKCPQGVRRFHVLRRIFLGTGSQSRRTSIESLQEPDDPKTCIVTEPHNKETLGHLDTIPEKQNEILTICETECRQQQMKQEKMHAFVDSNEEHLQGVIPGFSSKLLRPSPCRHQEIASPEPSHTVVSVPEVSDTSSEPDTKPDKELFRPSFFLRADRSTHKGPHAEMDDHEAVPPLPRVHGKSASEMSVGVQEALLASRFTPLVTPVTWKFILERSSYSSEDRALICTATCDQVVGSPFKTFLEKTTHPSVTKYLCFMSDSMMYLSTKESTKLEHYDRVLMNRARHLILQYLETLAPKQLNLSEELVEGLMRLLPVDKGDHLLRHAQDAVKSVS